jgi:type VI secretion system protein ImpH
MRKGQFDEFLPGGSGAAGLKHLFRLVVGTTFDCEVRLVLDKRDLVPAILGSPSDTLLGWKSWVGTGSKMTDSTDVSYLIEAAVQ